MIIFSAAAKKHLLAQQTSSRLTKGYVSKDTVRTYTSGLQRFQIYIRDHGITNLEDVTVDHLTNYLANLRMDGLHAKTVALQRIILRSFFRWASKNYKNVRNIAKEVERIRLERREAKHLDRQQQEAFLSFIRQDRKSKKRNAVIFELMLRTGARVSEIASMDIGSMGVSAEGIRVAFLGKGNKRRELFIPLIAEGLTGATEIHRFYNRLEEYLGRRRRLIPKEGHREALFLSNYGHRITPRNIQSAFKYYARRLNLKDFTPHSLRHTHVTNLLQNGVDVATIAKAVGHSSPTVTLSIYSHTDPQKLQEAATKAFA